jgi:hypothetical protein
MRRPEMRFFRRFRRPEPEPVLIEVDMANDIREAAEHWAAMRGQPFTAPLVEDKLRVAYYVSAQRQRQQQMNRRRWWQR